MAASRIGWAGAWVAFGFDVAVKAALLLILTFGIHILLGRRRLLARAALWNACLLGLLVLPLAEIGVPRIGISGLGWIGRAFPRIEEQAKGLDQAAADERPIEHHEPDPVRLDESDGTPGRDVELVLIRF